MDRFAVQFGRGFSLVYLMLFRPGSRSGSCPVKLILHPAVPAAGLSFLCCFRWVGLLVNPYHSWIYHDRWAAAPVFLPVLFNMVALWLLFTLVLVLARGPLRRRVALWSGVILFALWMLFEDLVAIWVWRRPHWISLATLAIAGVCWGVVNAFWRPGFLPLFERAQHFCSRMFAVAAVGAMVVAVQLCCYCWEARSLEMPRPLHAAAPEAALDGQVQKPRIIWILLDELSYRQVYERRFPSLDLPAFDELASEATVFTHVAPAANSTEIAVPSLMTGLTLDRIRAGGDGTLVSLHNPVTGRWQRFDSQDTVFRDALDQGFSTAVAGWYNPYCRILSDVLDHCHWIFHQSFGGGVSADRSIESNVAAPWIHLLSYIPVRRADDGGLAETSASAEAEGHIADYVSIVAAGDQLLEDSRADFVLLHIPVPHPGGIYDRRTKTFTTHHASYIDNLALADRYLGHVREVLEKRGEWDSSAIVVMGDHSWRTKLLWRGSPGWTAEDEAASDGGQFDDRPGYIVKLPGQVERARIDIPFAAARTRALLDGILDGSIRSEAELAAFAGQAAVPTQRTDVVATRVGGGGLRSRGQ